MGIQRRITTALVAGVLAAVSLTACADDQRPLTVGHGDSPEMTTAAAVYAGALARTGMDVETLPHAESQKELLDRVASGGLGLFPAFTGDLLVQLTPAPTAISAEDVIADVNRSLPQQVAIGDPASVSDRWQVLAGQDLKERSGVETLADCGRFPADLPIVVVQTPSTSVLDAIAGCHHGPVRSVPTVDELVTQVRTGRALGLATALDTASVTDLAGVQALKSDGPPIAQDLVPVFASGRFEKPQLKALSRVAGELTTADLAQLVREVRDGGSPRAVADQWLATHGV
ncbi:glycine betaine ABC transporter substrate-binding protein [Gordonia humi]|uniref:glycine betaine ABC transporter substrate-binding protein n=1 Tax=Gordonia humi TaxID=686429 RepID=UPI00361FD94C